MDPIAIGQLVPDFQLTDLLGKSHSLAGLRGRIAVFYFWSAECTWCERVDHELLTYIKAWSGQVVVWWIASNFNENPAFIHQMAAHRHLPIVLIDTQQSAADQFSAQTTPHFFIVDRAGKLAYQGAWDDLTFRQRTATQVYVPQVIAALLAERVPEITETPPYGCILVRP